jgi:hypothetical protein
MLKRIHSKILSALCEWYDKNVDKINQSDKMQILYNKTMIKLMIRVIKTENKKHNFKKRFKHLLI